MQERQIKTEADALKIFNHGLKSRKVNSTDMNSESSRSHLIFGLVVQIKNLKTGELTSSKLSLVDLAGSERSSKSNPNFNLERQKESNSINLSLTALGDVISSLTNDEVQKNHIPYRNNKLTHLMKDSLGGNSKTLMFLNVSPADYNIAETLNSL